MKIDWNKIEQHPFRFIMVISAITIFGVSLVVVSTTYDYNTPKSQLLPNYSPVTLENLAYYITLNHHNALIYQNDMTSSCSTIQSNSTYSVSSSNCTKGSITITHQEQKSANTKLLDYGYNASCLINCNGIIYTQDPTSLMTNNGHDFMFNCKDFGTASVITCTSTDFATFMMLSTSSTTPLVTNTACASSITTGGLADVSGTFSAGTASSGTVTSTLSHTWTAAETDSAVQLLCINTEVHSGTNVVLVYELTFGPDTLISGNTIAITLSATAT